MSPELLNLHISQLARTFEKSKTNKYADPRKQAYHDSLIDLFLKIKNQDRLILDYPEQKILKEILDFCFFSIEFLDNSTLVNIPYEIVYCLEKALSDWVAIDRFIIVTSLQNNILNYSFDPHLALDEAIYDLIESKYNIIFDHRLIQINLPKYLAHDYLANVVLYHELGHFVDLKFHISKRIRFVLGLGDVEENHYAELFSDVFASQYIGSASNNYLNYIAHKNPDCYSHPSTDSRIQIVEDFLNSNSQNVDLNNLLFATKAITQKDFKINIDKISNDDFTKFIPSIICTDFQLHSIFEVGWQLWKSVIKEYEVKNISTEEKYKIINNLIEKSISNYMITEKWKAHVLNSN